MLTKKFNINEEMNLYEIEEKAIKLKYYLCVSAKK